MYTVKEIFYTLQGEGANAGRAAVFCRFAGCNLWTGREADRATAICDFCDTDFVGVGPDGGKFATARELASAVASRWPHRDSTNVASSSAPAASRCFNSTRRRSRPCTTRDSRSRSRRTARRMPPPGIDWICVSPKAARHSCYGMEASSNSCFRSPDLEPERFESLDFEHFFLQPMDGPRAAENTQVSDQNIA